jgi:hypothetical protein
MVKHCQGVIKLDGLGKSPSAALRCIWTFSEPVRA